MIGKLPTKLKLGDSFYEIRTDYRDCLLIIQAFQDPDLSKEEAGIVMLKILYKDFDNIPEELYEEAQEKAVWFLDCGNSESSSKPKAPLYNFEQDEQIIFSAVNKVANKEIRALEYLHYWTFMGYFNEIGEGTFSTVVSIRNKKRKHIKLEKWELDFVKSNPELVNLRRVYSTSEKEQLDELNKLLGV